MAQTLSDSVTHRRLFLAGAGLLAATAFAPRSWAQAGADLRLPGGPSTRPLTDAFPGKRGMILQRTRPPLLDVGTRNSERLDARFMTPFDAH